MCVSVDDCHGLIVRTAVAPLLRSLVAPGSDSGVMTHAARAVERLSQSGMMVVFLFLLLFVNDSKVRALCSSPKGFV